VVVEENIVHLHQQFKNPVSLTLVTE